MLEIYNKIKNEEIKTAGSKDNILYIYTDKEDYELSINFLDEYDVFAELSVYAEPKWGVREKAS